MNRCSQLPLILALLVAALFCDPSPAQQPDFSKIAKYLDQRESDWFDWRGSQRGQSHCISCHTNLTYAISRRPIGDLVEDDRLTVYNDRLLNNTRKRVKNWPSIKLFYGGKRSSQSRGTEAVMNALILANEDQLSKRVEISQATREAFQHMWKEQIREGENRGGWHWLDFGLEPWESEQAAYYGASLAAIAAGKAPGNYSDDVSIQENLKTLRKYLMQKYGDERAAGDGSLSLYHRMYLLWASTELKGLLDSEQRKALMDQVFETQNPDGGWDLARLGGWKRIDNTEQSNRSDGYATGLIVYATLRAGHDRDDPRMKKAIAWLNSQLDPSRGTWIGISVNKDRSQASERVKGFMTSAATSMSALALSEWKRREQR